MTPEDKIGVRITKLHDSKTSVGIVRVQVWNSKERLLRALKFVLICWTVAIVSIVIPIAHFILVPGFLIAGPIGASVLLGQKSVILGGEGTCPNCQSILPIVRTKHVFPFTDLCSKCHTNVSIEPIES